MGSTALGNAVANSCSTSKLSSSCGQPKVSVLKFLLEKPFRHSRAISIGFQLDTLAITSDDDLIIFFFVVDCRPRPTQACFYEIVQTLLKNAKIITTMFCVHPLFKGNYDKNLNNDREKFLRNRDSNFGDFLFAE